MDDNMLRMQQEAVERVRQMQERARRFVEEPQRPAESRPTPAAMPAESRGVSSLLSGFGDDKEQLFLLMLAVLLVKNDAPIELVLALLYIAM